MKKVCIMGMGFVGTTLAALLCEKGIQVFGVDAKRDVVDRIRNGISTVNEPDVPELVKKYVSEGKLVATDDLSIISQCDVVLVTVGTPLGEDFSPDISAIQAVSKSIAMYLKPGHLVIYKSTVVPGTTEDIVVPLLESGSKLRAGVDFMLAYSPERIGEGSRMTDFTGSALEELRAIPIVIGGVMASSTNAANSFWKSLGIKTMVVSNPRVAELVKLADNWWIDLNIAMANEIALLSEKIGVDSNEVIEAANSLPKNRYNVNILLPGCGVGGSCLTKDPWFAHHLGKQLGVELKSCCVSRDINSQMPGHMFDLACASLKDAGKDMNGATVSVLGLAFKQSTGDIRHTPVRPLIELLIHGGAVVKAFDPWVSAEDAKRVSFGRSVGSLSEVVENSDCIILMNAQPEFRAISFQQISSAVHMPCSVVDGRRAFRQKDVVSAGFTYRAVGLGNNDTARKER